MQTAVTNLGERIFSFWSTDILHNVDDLCGKLRLIMGNLDVNRIYFVLDLNYYNLSKFYEKTFEVLNLK